MLEYQGKQFQVDVGFVLIYLRKISHLIRQLSIGRGLTVYWLVLVLILPNVSPVPVLRSTSSFCPVLIASVPPFGPELPVDI